jgi:hypothetical protein
MTVDDALTAMARIDDVPHQSPDEPLAFTVALREVLLTNPETFWDVFFGILDPPLDGLALLVAGTVTPESSFDVLSEIQAKGVRETK